MTSSSKLRQSSSGGAASYQVGLQFTAICSSHADSINLRSGGVPTDLVICSWTTSCRQRLCCVLQVIDRQISWTRKCVYEPGGTTRCSASMHGLSRSYRSPSDKRARVTAHLGQIMIRAPNKLTRICHELIRSTCGTL